jgi:hypothetical protein
MNKPKKTNIAAWYKRNGAPQSMIHLLGAEAAIRKLCWRLKRLGIDPKKVVHGDAPDVIWEMLDGRM